MLDVMHSRKVAENKDPVSEALGVLQENKTHPETQRDCGEDKV